MTPPAYLDGGAAAVLASLGKPFAGATSFTRLLASPTSRASAGCIGSTTTWCARTRWCCLEWAPVSFASRERDARWRCRSTATGASSTSIRIAGAQLAVAEAARNVACAGAQPIGATNCLNFGNPETAGNHVAVRTRGRGDRRRLPRARHSDHRRQRESLQRNRRPGGSADAGARRRRPHRRCRHASCAARSEPPETASSCSARRATSWAGASTSRSCTA